MQPSDRTLLVALQEWQRFVRATVEAMRKSQLVLALAIAACTKSEPSAGSGSGPAVAPASAGVEIYVNDDSVAKVTTADIAKWPRLDTLVPEKSRRLGTWQLVSVRGTGKSSEINRPSATYPELIPALFPGNDGAPSFGMFDPVELAKKGQPGLRTDSISEIRIKLSTEQRSGDHQGGGGATGDPAKVELVFKLASGDKKLTGEQIMAIPRETMPGNDDTKGWPLTKLLAAAGVTKYEKLALIDSGGTSLALARTDFDDKTTIPFIKLNRQGSLRFRLMKKQGTGWQAAGDLRALATIKVD